MRRRAPRRRARGSVTAETAVALPALVLVLTASLWAVAATGAQLRCVDAARAGARAAARGEAPEQVRAVVLRLAPADATVSVGAGTGTVRVEVTATVRPLWRSFLPPVRLRASAVSDTEPGVLPPPPTPLTSARFMSVPPPPTPLTSARFMSVPPMSVPPPPTPLTSARFMSAPPTSVPLTSAPPVSAPLPSARFKRPPPGSLMPAPPVPSAVSPSPSARAPSARAPSARAPSARAPSAPAPSARAPSAPATSTAGTRGKRAAAGPDEAHGPDGRRGGGFSRRLDDAPTEERR
ncbi:TadE family type IV pilus minor pilin [Microbispora amethystogenes]|uniref:TadE family type IV pilus minor pilin n=1 Tax=Microbispora amethystogenes TaxID=1427754 RepID=UPI0019541664|nr:TadE family type IV pilus minor pilin [Microbispora amethystogenes]